MATSRMAVGSILATVSNTANSLSSIVTTVNDGVDMLHDYVRTARTKQQLHNKAMIKNLPTIIKEDIARDTVMRRKDISDWLKSSPELGDMYQQALSELDHIFEEA